MEEKNLQLQLEEEMHGAMKQHGFIQLSIIAIMVGIMILAGGVGYIILSRNRNNPIKETNQKQESEKQVPPKQSQESISCLNLASATPLNNLPEGIAAAIVQKYFASFPDRPYPPADVDKSTFIVLPKSYFHAEKNSAYHGEIYLPSGEGIILTLGYYAKDKNHVYAAGKILPEADPATFNFIGEVTKPPMTPYTKDKNHVWVSEKIIDSADSCTFTVLSENWAKDKHQVYNHYYDKYNHSQPNIIVNADPATFRLTAGDDRFAQDKNHVFRFDGKVLVGADPSSFVILDKVFEKDKSYVFFDGDIITGADAKTFTPVGKSRFFKDVHHLYEDDHLGGGSPTLKILSPAGMDTLTLEALNGEYFKDRNNVYIGGPYDGFTQIKNADPATFQILNVCASVEKSAGYYTKDKNNVYCGTTTISGADPTTFEFVGGYDDNPGGMPLSSGVGKDKNCVYRREKRVLDSTGVCVKSTSCTTGNLASNPSSCGIYGGLGEFQ